MRLAVFVVALFSPALAVAADLPKRKSGLWHVVMTTERPPQVQVHECVDKNTDDMTKPEAGTSCSKIDVRRQGGGYVVDSVCKEEGSTATSRMVFSGNFETAYKAEGKTTFKPPLEGVAELKLKIEGRWLAAACKPGQQPGDVELVDTAAMRDAVKGAQKKR